MLFLPVLGYFWCQVLTLVSLKRFHEKQNKKIINKSKKKNKIKIPKIEQQKNPKIHKKNHMNIKINLKFKNLIKFKKKYFFIQRLKNFRKKK